MTKLTYREALDWLYHFSDTERTGKFVRDREDNLRRERALLAALGDPHRAYGVTHIAGSKGKGSTAAMLAAVLHAAGMRVGLYTQPDLHTFRERIRVGPALIGEQEVADLIPELQGALATVDETLGPFITYDLGTALAFLYFQRAGVQHAVIEVGLGGRLDATNVVEPLVAVITSISYEHMEVLGHTLTAIATEKAGIVKPGVPTICSAQAPEALAAIAQICAARRSPLVRVGPEGASGAAYTYRPQPTEPAPPPSASAPHQSGENFASPRPRRGEGLGVRVRTQRLDVRGPDSEYRDLELALLGAHQMENAAAVVATVETLVRLGLPIDEAALREGLRTVRWPARLQVVGERPWLIVDGAHNADSMTRLGAALRRHFAYDRLVLVLGLLADKDLAGIADAVSEMDAVLVIATTANSPRAMPPERLAQALCEATPELTVRVEPSLPAALEAAVATASPSDLVCVAGSVYLAGEALRWFAAHGGAAAMAPIEIAGVDH